MGDVAWAKHLDFGDIKLGRVGHYCKPVKGKDHSCFKADVIAYRFDEALKCIVVDIVAWDSRLSAPEIVEVHRNVKVVPHDSLNEPTFHLNRECKWDR
jgi:hypothetical protein